MKRNWFESIVAKTAAGLGAALLTTCIACCPADDGTPCCPADTKTDTDTQTDPTPAVAPDAVPDAVPDVAPDVAETGKTETLIVEPDPVPVADLSSDGVWLTDFEAAKTRAAAENRPMLLLFTGSDWCPPCKNLHKVMATPEFEAWAAKSVVLVEFDFPRSLPQTPALTEQNAAQGSAFGIRGYPTVVVATADGKEIHRAVGFGGGTVEDYTAGLDAAMNPVPVEEPAPVAEEPKPAEEPEAPKAE